MTETAWQRTSKYESSVQSPPQTTIWQLATRLKLQNAPQIALPAALPTCSWNEDLGKRWERGTPPKKNQGWKQQETRKTANQSRFWTSHDFKNQNTQRYGQGTKENICKTRSPSKNEQHIWTSERQDSQQRNKGEQRKMTSFRMNSL